VDAAATVGDPSSTVFRLTGRASSPTIRRHQFMGIPLATPKYWSANREMLE
jgi:hypothetical protein